MTGARTSFRTVLLMLAVVCAAGLFWLTRVVADETNHEGMILAVNPQRIVIINREGSMTRSFPLSQFVRVTRGGQMATLNSLARGDLVFLTTDQQLGTEIVVAIDTIPHN